MANSRGAQQIATIRSPPHIVASCRAQQIATIPTAPHTVAN